MMRNVVQRIAEVYTPGEGWSSKAIIISLNEDYEIRIEDGEGNLIQFDLEAIDELHENEEVDDYSDDDLDDVIADERALFYDPGPDINWDGE